MYWSVVDGRLIRRGELLLGLDFLEGYDAELTGLNVGKVGRPFKITVRYVEFLMVVRYLFSMPYRQLEGFTRALSRLIPKLPSVDYSWIRDTWSYKRSRHIFGGCGGLKLMDFWTSI